MTTEGIAGLVAWVVFVSASTAVLAQERRAPTDEVREVIDAMVADDRLVSLERTPCDASRAYEAAECASLISSELASGRERWRTPLHIRMRGLIQLEREPGSAARRGFLLRAFDRAVLIDADGHEGSPFPVPPSTLQDPVGLEEASGAFVFHEHGGCGVYLVGQNELGSGGRYLRGVESHVYPHGGGPHDTVCFGFSARPVGEIRVGTRPLPRGRGGAIRHGIETLVLVAVTSLAHPVRAEGLSLVAFGRSGVAFAVEAAPDGARLESTGVVGSGPRAQCQIGWTDGTTHWVSTIECGTGQVLGRASSPPTTEAAPADPSVSADTGHPVIVYDRRGTPVPRFPRCFADEGVEHSRVLFDGAAVVDSTRRILVLDQRGDTCIAVELADASHPGDTLHRLTR